MKHRPEELFIDSFDYPLLTTQIAEFPLAERDASRLLIYDGGKITDASFATLPDFLPQNATLVVNNTRVIEARLHFQKTTGGIIEIFCLEPSSPKEIVAAMSATDRVEWQCLIGGASKWKPGQVLQKEILVEGQPTVLCATYVMKEEDHFVIAFSWEHGFSFAQILHEAGAIPLPPYIKRKAEKEDEERYQTIFATYQGSVAAPTAALHFTDRVFKKLGEKNINRVAVTLHVGAGTFKPVKTETIAAHEMHGEGFSVTADTLEQLIKAETIVAVGTTSLRTLESLYWLGLKLLQGHTDFELKQWEAYELNDGGISYRQSLEALRAYLHKMDMSELNCRTSLIIIPGYQFRSAKGLVTNFHQPRSTLLLLVAAFVGDDWKRIYEHALASNYRFLSYGDSSLLWRKD